jgi:hypothetical protein
MPQLQERAAREGHGRAGIPRFSAKATRRHPTRFQLPPGYSDHIFSRGRRWRTGLRVLERVCRGKPLPRHARIAGSGPAFG